ncbi:MAG: DUF1579 domain-containing protein [Planctomycetota bacterium]|jgi:hypothetical protein
MRAKYLMICLLIAAATGFIASHAVSQEQDPKMAEWMQLWQKYATPGEHHEALAQFIGKWDTETKMFMQPGAPPMTSKGSAEFKWLFPNRWLAQEYKGSMMGMPYSGFGIVGWDNYKKKHVQVWVDTLSTDMKLAEGVVVDPEGQVQVLYGTMDEYLTGEHDKIVKYVTRNIDKDTFVFEIWDMGMGAEGGKVIEMKYTRKG